ncbi:MAG: pilus assembly protein [Actinobacteria bacterium]|nr:pilus assembly protein [Actinomycetota bacterium]
MVEFALVIPVLLLLVMGIIQFGILFNNYVTLTDAVRAGARQAAVSRDLPDPVMAATNRVKQSGAGLDASKLEITVTPYDPTPPGSATWVQGGDVTVKAKYPYAINLFGVVVMSGKLESTTTERVE